MMDILEGERVILRPISEEDTADILRWRNSRHVMEHFIIREPLTEEMHKKWLREQVAAGHVEQYVIIVKESGHGIGSQYFQRINREDHSAEFGIFIGEKEELGKGYGREVLDLSLRHARDDMKLKRVSLRVLDDNDVAYRLYVSRGFKPKPGSAGTAGHEGINKKIIYMELEF